MMGDDQILVSFLLTQQAKLFVAYTLLYFICLFYCWGNVMLSMNTVEWWLLVFVPGGLLKCYFLYIPWKVTGIGQSTSALAISDMSLALRISMYPDFWAPGDTTTVNRTPVGHWKNTWFVRKTQCPTHCNCNPSFYELCWVHFSTKIKYLVPG